VRTVPKASAPKGGGGESEDEGGGSDLSKLPGPDRHAYFQLASVVGVLNKDISLIEVSHLVKKADTAALPVLRRRIAPLRPRDPLLRRLRGQTLGTIDLSIRSRRQRARALRAAPRLQRRVNRIIRGLTLYAKRHTAVGAYVPD